VHPPIQVTLKHGELIEICQEGTRFRIQCLSPCGQSLQKLRFMGFSDWPKDKGLSRIFSWKKVYHEAPAEKGCLGIISMA